jgi:hypothetical protein
MSEETTPVIDIPATEVVVDAAPPPVDAEPTLEAVPVEHPAISLFDELRNYLNRLPAEIQNEAHALASRIKALL